MPPDAKTRVEHELFLRSFSAARPTARVTSQLSSLMHDEYYDKGETLFTRGSAALRIYFVVAGRVELVRDGVDPWVLEGESIIGILDASRGRPYSRTAIATRPTHAISLLFSDYLEVLEDNFDYTLRTMKLATIRNAEMAIALGSEAFEHLGEPTTPPLGAECLTRGLDIPTRLLALNAAPLFHGAPVQALVTLAEHAKVRHFEQGTRVLTTGEPATHLEVLVHGTARLEQKDASIDVLVAPTRILGGAAAFGYDEVHFDVTAQTDLTTLAIEKEDLLDVMEDHFGLLRSFFALVSTERERLLQFSHPGSSVPPSRQQLRG